MDIALWSYNKGMPASDLAKMINIDIEHAEYVYKDIESKRKTTAYLHAKPYLIENVLN